METLYLYTTLGCHLCELAERMLNTELSSNWQLVPVEISENPILIEQYGIRIPVIANEQGVELGWPFNIEELGLFLQHTLQESVPLLQES